MTSISLTAAVTIAEHAVAFGVEHGYDPLTVAVLDPGGHPVVLHRQDGSGILRPDIATAKAWGVLGLGVPNREIARRAAAAPAFFTSVAVLAQGRILDVPGGVFVRPDNAPRHGARGVTGPPPTPEGALAAEPGERPAR
uniref:GlcG/HbpS family heme-binding protein n=1 Tax=Nocardia farcinica TaxID=37329 RepID=UPI002457D0D0